jgi:hypothetical protein
MRLDLERRPMLPALVGLPTTITPGASPYAYTATDTGMVYVSGGTVSLVSLARGGTSVATGLLAGGIFMRAGDVLTTTYAVAPTMTWVPA